jgi:phospholipid/cholesterol/gamma-HCH transport system permease protein
MGCARGLRSPRAWLGRTLEEAARQTSDALPLSLLLATLGGTLIALQTGYQFQGNLPAWVVGSIVASSVVTESTPLFVGLALIGMIGTRIAAELGTMQVTEQVDALEVMGRDPVLYLVLPRVLAALFVGPMIMGLALAVSMVAGWMAAVAATHASSSDFWFGVRQYMRDFPPFFALIKGFAFGGATAFAACYMGLEAAGGSIGVGRTVRAAVVTMLIVLVALDTALAPLLKVIPQ